MSLRVLEESLVLIGGIASAVASEYRVGELGCKALQEMLSIRFIRGDVVFTNSRMFIIDLLSVKLFHLRELSRTFRE